MPHGVTSFVITHITHGIPANPVCPWVVLYDVRRKRRRGVRWKRYWMERTRINSREIGKDR